MPRVYIDRCQMYYICEIRCIYIWNDYFKTKKLFSFWFCLKSFFKIRWKKNPKKQISSHRNVTEYARLESSQISTDIEYFEKENLKRENSNFKNSQICSKFQISQIFKRKLGNVYFKLHNNGEWWEILFLKHAEKLQILRNL